jgi:hypothetical protein
MNSLQAIINLVIGCVFIGLGISEAVFVNEYTNLDIINDVTRCFFIVMSVLNCLTGSISVYLSVVYLCKETVMERYTVSLTTGMNIWGIVMYFRYSSLVIPVFSYLLLAEFIWICVRFGIVLFLSCITCQPSEEIVPK